MSCFAVGFIHTWKGCELIKNALEQKVTSRAAGGVGGVAARLVASRVPAQPWGQVSRALCSPELCRSVAGGEGPAQGSAWQEAAEPVNQKHREIRRRLLRLSGALGPSSYEV